MNKDKLFINTYFLCSPPPPHPCAARPVSTLDRRLGIVLEHGILHEIGQFGPLLSLPPPRPTREEQSENCILIGKQ